VASERPPDPRSTRNGNEFIMSGADGEREGKKEQMWMEVRTARQKHVEVMKIDSSLNVWFGNKRTVPFGLKGGGCFLTPFSFSGPDKNIC